MSKILSITRTPHWREKAPLIRCLSNVLPWRVASHLRAELVPLAHSVSVTCERIHRETGLKQNADATWVIVASECCVYSFELARKRLDVA